MNVATAIAEFRLDNYIDINQLSDNNALIFLNRWYRKLINEIRTKVNEDYFYNEWTVDSVIWQIEYSLEKRDFDTPWIVKIKWVSLKYKDEYIKAVPTTFSNLERDLSWYETNQPNSQPFYIVSDNSVFIYPKFTEVITNWIKLYWIADPIDLILSSTEWDIKIPLEYHYLLPLSMAYYSFKARWMINEKNDCYNDLNIETAKMIRELSDRIVSPLISEMPNITNLW